MDATDLGRGEEWCASQGFLDPDGTGRLYCPFGPETPEGMAQRRACEARDAPYRWYFQGIECDPEPRYAPDGTPLSACWQNRNQDGTRNPLQIRVAGPPTITGWVKVCSADGACSEADCSFDSPVCAER